MGEEYQTTREKPSKAWYLLPIFLGVIGGIIGYFLLKDRNKKMAERLLITGVIIWVVGFILSIVIVVFGALYSMGVFSVRPTVICSPCFSYFAFVDYSNGQLMLRNGPRQITITGVDGGTLSGGPNFNPADTIYIVGVQTYGEPQITVNYQDITSGSPFVDSAVIHNK